MAAFFLQFLDSTGFYYVLRHIPLIGWIIDTCLIWLLVILSLIVANLPGLMITFAINKDSDIQAKKTIFGVAIAMLVIYGSWGISLLVTGSEGITPSSVILPLINGVILFFYQRSDQI